MKAKEIINWVVYFVCLLAVVFVINTFVVQSTNHGQRRFYVSVSAQQGSADDG